MNARDEDERMRIQDDESKRKKKELRDDKALVGKK